MTALEQHLLDTIQDAFPLEERPYQMLADKFSAQGVPVTEQQVFEAVENLRNLGVIRRIGGVYDSKRLGFISRLCAGKVPTVATGATDDSALESFATAVNAVPAITHNYVRAHEYNVWFTVIAENEAEVQNVVDRLCAETTLHDVHILSVMKKFKINTVMRGAGAPVDSRQLAVGRNNADESQAELSLSDKARIRIACTDIPHTLTPFMDWGVSIEELREDLAQKRMRRFGAILRHQQAGFAYNAMVCFGFVKFPELAEGTCAGDLLAKNPHVSHCYERPAFDGFPYTLYAMMHAQSAEDLDRYVKEAAQSIGNPDYAVLYSVRELKKTSFAFFA
ncbi:MAG: Lrp/AsnC family transcriptional regulator [Fibrobacter sp.]|nr:Lrp/AsnC family transcriptional regulator [Fibrobacter sp.]